MAQYSASSVGVLADHDHGKGRLVFRWPDKRQGHETLEINLDGHCSRRMPLRSGSGPFAITELRRDGVRFRFEPALARKLQLEEEVEILFQLTDAMFDDLRRMVDYFNRV